MGHYVVIGWDAEGSKEKRPAIRPAHLEHWKDWDDAGKIVVAGPMTDFAGSLFIVEGESEAEVRAKADSDPYLHQGVFNRVEVHPFRAVLPTKTYG